MRKKIDFLGEGHAFAKEGFPFLAISFYTRACALENAIFANPLLEQPNLAFSFCQSVMKLNAENRALALQNIILAGGTVMIPGFKMRFKQEVKKMIETIPEFEELKQLRKMVKIPDSIYAPNCLAWVGASIMMSLSTGQEQIKESERFLITAE